MTHKNACIERLDQAIALIGEMKALLTSGEEDAPAAFLEASHEVIGRLNDAVTMTLCPLLEVPAGGRGAAPAPRDDAVVLEIYLAGSGQWTGRLLGGGEEVGGVAGCTSVDVKRTKVDTNLY